MAIDAYIAVDLEMTGLNPKSDRILEIGAVKVVNGKAEGTFEKLILQEAALDERITALTGITDDMARQGEALDTAVEAFLDFAEDLVWVGHNVIFDYSFIKQWEVNHRICRTRYAIDTLKIARKCLPDLPKKTLDALCAHYGIARTVRHRALEDARANSALLERLKQEYQEKEPALFVAKELQYKAKRQTPATPAQKKYLMRLMRYHKIMPEAAMERLTRSEASRLTDRIILQYGKIPAGE